MNTIEQVQNAIYEVEKTIGAIEIAILDKQKEIDSFEYSCTDDEYDEMLDDVYGDVEVCGVTYSSSRALKLLDPTAYRCSKCDYESNYDLDDVEEYNDLKDELETLEDQLSDIENELNELNSELESLENEQRY